jgi:hypothetical protein
MHAVKLEELSVILADFLFDVAVPKIGGQAERAIRLFVQRDVIWAFEPDDVIAFGFIFIVAPGFGVLEQGQAHFLARRVESFDILDLRFYGSEVTHWCCYPFG